MSLLGAHKLDSENNEAMKDKYTKRLDLTLTAKGTVLDFCCHPGIFSIQDLSH